MVAFMLLLACLLACLLTPAQQIVTGRIDG